MGVGLIFLRTQQALRWERIWFSLGERGFCPKMCVACSWKGMVSSGEKRSLSVSPAQAACLLSPVTLIFARWLLTVIEYAAEDDETQRYY